MIGWRCWRIDSNRLVPPFAEGTALPPDCVVKAACSDHPAPDEDCECGVYFMASASDMLRWVRHFGFYNAPDHALTCGTPAGRMLRGVFGAGEIRRPAVSWRSAEYRVRGILTMGEVDYDVPILKGPMTTARMTELAARSIYLGR